MVFKLMCKVHDVHDPFYNFWLTIVLEESSGFDGDKKERSHSFKKKILVAIKLCSTAWLYKSWKILQ